MQITRSKIQYLPTTIMIVVGVLVWVLMASDAIAWYPATYTESAHGNSTVGVNRSGLSGYSVGNCVHCHGQHASIGGCPDTPNDFALFAPNNPDSQDDNFCFQCHKGTGSVQDGGITNKDYSHTFGGAADPPDFTNIYDAFNPTGTYASSHNLKDIQDLHTGLYGFTSDNNACVACHNPHTAQRNYEVTASGRGGVKTAIRDVTVGYRDRPTNLWGDENGLSELTSDPGGYQAPYRVGKITYEPAGQVDPTNGSNLPGYAYFCTRCHQYATIESTERGTLQSINWTSGGDAHGLHANLYDDLRGRTKSPYTADETTNYVLSCTDCHEPHGSTNEWLLRTCVNGKDNISITVAGQWYEFCTACHFVYGLSEHQVGKDCVGSTCHGHSSPQF